MKLLTTVVPAVTISALLSTAVLAETFDVTITNATGGQVLTPPVVVTHSSTVQLFELGMPAPAFLIPLAEDGDTSAFVGADALAEVSDVAIAGGAVMPGHSVTLTVETTQKHPLISLAGMFASSNDAFMALNSKALDFSASSTTHYATVYDAGSEANSEDCQYIPGPPCGNGGVRDTDNAEGFVHVHSGIHGIKDLQAAQYSWNYPGAVITIKMK